MYIPIWQVQEYAPVLVFFGVAAVISLIIFGASYFVSVARSDVEKISAYECGFDPFEDARTTFDVRFYLVGILFIIFDLEVSFLFPWAIQVTELGYTSIVSRVLFLGILTVGFVYEWKKGALSLE
jgi:NADH-quinone oxidoreductase subunit A